MTCSAEYRRVYTFPSELAQLKRSFAMQTSAEKRMPPGRGLKHKAREADYSRGEGRPSELVSARLIERSGGTLLA